MKVLTTNFRQPLFLVSRHWNNHLNWPRLWRNYEFIVTADEEIPTKAWKSCNQYLTHYGQHVRNLKVRFDFDQENRPIHNIQNFLSIFKVIMSKLIKKSAQLETIDISEFRFGFNECWDAMVKGFNLFLVCSFVLESCSLIHL